MQNNNNLGYGENKTFTVLSNIDVQNIKILISKGIKQKDIASEFNISISTVQKIKYGKTHKNDNIKINKFDDIRYTKPAFKLEVKDVKNIFALCHSNNYTQQEIANMYTVSAQTISDISIQKRRLSVTKDLLTQDNKLNIIKFI